MARKSVYLVLVVAILVAGASAQVRVGGPRPEVRDHLDSLVKAYNSGSPDEWEKFAQAHFAAQTLSARSQVQRKQFYSQMRKDLGDSIAITKVTREGPDEPLHVSLKTTSGEAATLIIDLEGAAPYRIRDIKVGVDDQADEQQPSHVPAAPINPHLSNNELSRSLDSYLQKFVSADTFSGAVLLAKDDTPVFQRAYGDSDRANHVPNDIKTRFNLGSINKQFTKTAIQQLITRGKLSLTDTVGALLPDYPQRLTRSATVDQLLNHSAGVADFFGPEFERLSKSRFRSNADYYDLVSHQTPLFVPGARNEYCNGCYIVLGAIIGRISGMPYEKYVEENIFKPAGMTSTGSLESDDIVPNVAMGYTHRDGDGLRSNILTRGAAGSAAGGGYSTVTDLFAFTQALKNGRIPDVKATAEPYAVAGGSLGINAMVSAGDRWTVVVLTNLDPPTGQELGMAISRALTR